MAWRKLAGILVRNGVTCVRGGGVTFPLWKPQEHINYMLSGKCSDLIVASDSSQTLLELNILGNINIIAALGWSGVREVRNLFEAGYSKIFLGGADRSFPSQEEAEIFAEMVGIYGSSSFGYSFHFENEIPQIEPSFLNHFNEVLIIENKVQLYTDREKCIYLASQFEKNIKKRNLQLNLCGPKKNHTYWMTNSNVPVNYVNYCEHGIAILK